MDRYEVLSRIDHVISQLGASIVELETANNWKDLAIARLNVHARLRVLRIDLIRLVEEERCEAARTREAARTALGVVK